MPFDFGYHLATLSFDGHLWRTVPCSKRRFPMTTTGFRTVTPKIGSRRGEDRRSESIDLAALNLDWDRATARFKKDVRDDFFPDPLHYRDLFTALRPGAAKILALDDYAPEMSENWDAPKSNFTLRHCINIGPVDRLVYQALVDALAAECDAKFLDCSYAYRLRSADDAEMYKSFVAQNAAFHGAVRARLQTDTDAFVVTLDVAQYFENISFSRLHEKLIELIGARVGSLNRLVVDLLIQCLNHWSPYGHVGLPQNLFPSSLLGNVYLHSLDEVMRAKGFDYHRYMDDVRVIAKSEAEARMALRTAIVHLRELELSVNGKKTGIVRPNTPEWKEFAKEPDSDLADIDTTLNAGRKEDMPALIVRLNDLTQQLLKEPSLPVSRLRFCLGRLETLRRNRALSVPEPGDDGPKLMQLVRDWPEETTVICRYFETGGCSPAVADVLAGLLTSDPVCIYGWQNYRLWSLAAKHAPSRPELVERARHVLRGGHEPSEVSGAALYLGSTGDPSDVAKIAEMLDDPKLSVSVRRCLCIAIQGLDVALRTAVWQRLSDTSLSLELLARYLGGLERPTFVAAPRRVPLGRAVDELPDDY